MKLKALNRQAVRMAATMLMLAEGSTTTLNVKLYLRDQGYRAGQSEVSSWLFRIAQRERWVINDNGLFRVYYFPNFMSKLLMPASAPTQSPSIN
ncbi:hypothetical protein FAES_0721 [Fibrella aestuarina BUZ 2]|uniref:Uncharacterized protein n=1 Tax=Fibrella aestuarina BUZ 2 TaxID=1166018 RepID=I0K3M9_9BACT|nr:hypothetical protein [Fibrella aestuarina]CCG98732.1 hypothetical protein FAES_0721 [Fibrella aestuarina BUZ 2]